jgi:hypothetical protein
MAEIAPTEDQPTPVPAKTSSAKRIALNVGLYLTPFVFAAALVLWGNLLSAWVVILSGCFVFGLVVFAVTLHLRDIGGRARLEAYIHDHLWSSIFAIVIVCCLILGTGTYLYVRPPHVKTEANKPVSVSAPSPPTPTNDKPTIPPTDKHASPPPSSSAPTTHASHHRKRKPAAPNLTHDEQPPPDNPTPPATPNTSRAAVPLPTCPPGVAIIDFGDEVEAKYNGGCGVRINTQVCVFFQGKVYLNNNVEGGLCINGPPLNQVTIVPGK